MLNCLNNGYILKIRNKIFFFLSHIHLLLITHQLYGSGNYMSRIMKKKSAICIYVKAKTLCRSRKCSHVDHLMWWDPASDQGGSDNVSPFQSQFSRKSRGPGPGPLHPRMNTQISLAVIVQLISALFSLNR